VREAWSGCATAHLCGTETECEHADCRWMTGYSEAILHLDEPIGPVYNGVGAVKRFFKRFFILFHNFLAAPRTPLALRAESGVKGAQRSGAFIEEP